LSGYILVVDDEPDVRELFKITLSMAGYRTQVAKDGLEAIDAISKESPQLIVLDLMMPRLDGFGVLTKLREEEANGKLKVLIATAKTLNDGDKEHLDSWPVVGVLNKGELDIAKMVVDVQQLLAD
jgi:CheY-like chemotaxis protein